jgi:MFS transporter, SP family, sugar:H+ symporter
LTCSSVWIVTAEVPTLQLREKTIMTGTFLGFCVSVIVTFVSPYLQDAGYGNLGGRVGFVYGGFSVVAAIWCFFFLPETRGRSLEELDELFAAKVSVWRFSSYKATGAGAQLAEVEHAMAHGGHGLERNVKVIEAMDEEEGHAPAARPVKE